MAKLNKIDENLDLIKQKKIYQNWINTIKQK